MHRFRRILYVAEGSVAREGPGLRRAAALARANRGSLTLGLVVGEAAGERPEVGDVEGEEIRERVSAAHEARLAALAAKVRGLGVEAETVLLEGRPFMGVIERVLAADHDVVLKVAAPAAGLRGRLTGSLDQHLLRKCPAPVWLFAPGSGERFRSVLAAVDVTSRVAGELNERIVQLASSLAVREGAALHVVHAWTLYAESILRCRSRGLAPGRLRVLRRETRRSREQRLKELVAAEAVEGSEPALHLVKARPPAGIRHVAGRVAADVVVMGTLSRAGAAGLLIGNTAELVLCQLECAALTVKPAGFVSPVEVEAGRQVDRAVDALAAGR